MKEIFTESLRYWEPRRLAFNAALALVVAGSFWVHRSSADGLTWRPVVGLLLAAVVANVLYCAAYAVDWVLSISAYQPVWKGRRWMLLAAGTVLAAGVFLYHE